jgi:mutator protein MutT
MELWEIYNKNREKTGRIINRHSKDVLHDGEYHLVTEAIIINSAKQILLSKRAEFKQKYPLMWECTCGSVKKGETTLDAILRELKEELGINLRKKDAKFFKTLRDDNAKDFKDIWIFYTNIELEQLKYTDNEVIDTKWVTIEELNEMMNRNEIVPTIDFNISECEGLLNYM